ncbi:ATP synthase subunit I [Vibrio sp. AK197]|uniref:ATP synthase subunit I n=1 Tax=Vibrio olivae TaxID=1243002 RepID=A0ABV5HNY1_9VIBR
MEASSTSDSIMLAGKRILITQLVIGLVFVLFELFSGGVVGVESAVTGVVIAIIPSMAGMLFASMKSKMKPTESLRDLMNLSRNIKLIYTIILFILTFRFMALRNIVVLIAFSLTMFGHFFTPLFKDQDERKA